MNYGEVLSSAWKIIWKYKVLWIFGILAGLGSGGGSGSGGSGGSNRGGSDSSNNFFPSDIGSQVTAWIENNWWIIAVLVILALLLMIVMVVLGTYGRIGLARGAWQADDGVPSLSFAGLFSESGRYFWRVFLLSLLIFVVSLVAVVVIAVPTALVTALTLGVGLICLLPVICVLSIVAWLAQIVVELAVIAIVNEDLGTIDGLKRAWEVSRSHLGDMVVVGLIVMLGGGLIGVLIGLPFLAAVIPLAAMAFSQASEVVTGSVIAAGVLFCLYLPVAIFLSGVLKAYTGTIWTLTFRRMTGRGLPAVPAMAVEVIAPQ